MDQNGGAGSRDHIDHPFLPTEHVIPDIERENVECSQTQRGQLVDRHTGGGIIPSRSVISRAVFTPECAV
jgi:hypothetical protein